MRIDGDVTCLDGKFKPLLMNSLNGKASVESELAQQKAK